MSPLSGGWSHCVIPYGMLVPVAVWQVRLRTAISVFFTTLFQDNHGKLSIDICCTCRRSAANAGSVVLRAEDEARHGLVDIAVLQVLK